MPKIDLCHISLNDNSTKFKLLQEMALTGMKYFLATTVLGDPGPGPVRFLYLQNFNPNEFYHFLVT